jgi:Flp pilus assembly protein TadD
MLNLIKKKIPSDKALYSVCLTIVLSAFVAATGITQTQSSAGSEKNTAASQAEKNTPSVTQKMKQNESSSQPEDEPAETVSEQYSSAVMQLKDSMTAGAATTLEDILQQDPNHVPAMINLARAYIDLQQYDKAEKVILDAVEMDSSNAAARRVKGRVMQSTGDMERAISSYRESIELESRNPYAYNNLGLIYIRQQRYRDAIPLLEKAVEQKEDITFFHNNLGIAYEGNGDLMQAEQSFRRSLELDPDYTKASGNLARVQDELTDEGFSQDTTGSENETEQDSRDQSGSTDIARKNPL